ncbi:MAG: N-acetyltransferase [Cyanobacteriota/Melainabacteria group bacterium]|nr:GNAT family N-acetyltransferase [Candidatus Obscuribacterales bacterium]
MRIESYRSELPEIVLAQIVEIYLECFTGPPRNEEWTEDGVRGHLLKLLAGDADVFVVVEGNAAEIVSFGIGLPMVGYFNSEELIGNGADPESYYFAELGTRSSRRGQGYGAALQTRREQAAQERGYKSLSVRVRADNLVTIRLLEKQGFSRRAQYIATLAGSQTERVLMEKECQDPCKPAQI